MVDRDPPSENDGPPEPGAEPAPDRLPEHLRPLFEGSLGARAAATVERVLSDRTERISTSRMGRAFSMSKLAMRGTSRMLMDRARDAMRRADEPDGERGVALASEMVRTFSQMRGVSMKLGQMLSYLDDALPPEARRVLAVLQRDASPMPWDAVSAELAEELGRPVREAFAEMDHEPMASASIGQVHRARLPDGTEVAVKIQYPGIEDAMRADLKNARVMSLFQRMFFFRTDTAAIMEELEQRFMDECDYEKEAEYQEAYRARLAGHPTIVVPEVHRSHTSRRVLTTTLERGRSFYQWLASEPSGPARDLATRTFYRFYIGSFYLDGLFNCDPHPGNYLFREDGKIVFLDYGCSRRFEPERLALWVQLCQAVFLDDGDTLERLAVEVGFVEEGADYDRDAFRSLMRYLYQPYLTDAPFDFAEHRPEDTFRRMFLDNPNLFKLNMPADAVFLNRIGFGLVSLMAEIGSSLNCRHYARSYFRGLDPDWPEDPHRGATPFDQSILVDEA